MDVVASSQVCPTSNCVRHLEFQESLELALMGGRGVEVDGKSDSIKSISDSI
jgi:hypothetical protein